MHVELVVLPDLSCATVPQLVLTLDADESASWIGLDDAWEVLDGRGGQRVKLAGAASCAQRTCEYTVSAPGGPPRSLEVDVRQELTLRWQCGTTEVSWFLPKGLATPQISWHVDSLPPLASAPLVPPGVDLVGALRAFSLCGARCGEPATTRRDALRALLSAGPLIARSSAAEGKWLHTIYSTGLAWATVDHRCRLSSLGGQSTRDTGVPRGQGTQSATELPADGDGDCDTTVLRDGAAFLAAATDEETPYFAMDWAGGGVSLEGGKSNIHLLGNAVRVSGGARPVGQ